jgi:N-formylglutamate amidohydrolase
MADDELWTVHRADLPMLSTAIHDGHGLRPEVAELMALPDDIRLREEDPYTARFAEVVANRVVPLRSRFEVDLNRAPERAIYRSPEDAWGLQVWKEELPDEVADVSRSEYRAFYDVVRAILDDAEQRFGAFVVLDLHSYNHRRDGADAPPADPAGNPDVNVGTSHVDRDRFGPVVHRFIADLGGHTVSGRPIDVRENVRFKGAYLTEWVQQTYPENGCALAVEFKKIFMDEWTGELFEEVIEELVTALSATLPGLHEVLSEL